MHDYASVSLADIYDEGENVTGPDGLTMPRVQMLMEAGDRRRNVDHMHQAAAVGIGMGGGEEGKTIAQQYELPAPRYPDEQATAGATHSSSAPSKFDESRWWGEEE